MTNAEYADALEKIAERYRGCDDEEIEKPKLHFFVTSKASVVSLIRMFGGTWTKRTDHDDSTYARIRLESKTMPLYIAVPRDSVCRRTVRFECDPLFSPEDAREIEEITK
jgi:hypothetical protein